MDQVYCSNCDLQLTAEPKGTPQRPCPNCGATKRKFTKTFEGDVVPSGDLMGEALRDNQPVGFVESGHPDLTRHATLTSDGKVRLNLRGLSQKANKTLKRFAIF